MNASSLIRCWKILANDHLRYNKAVRLAAWAAFMAQSAAARGLRCHDWGAYPAGIDEACSAARSADSNWQMRMAENMALRRLAGHFSNVDKLSRRCLFKGSAGVSPVSGDFSGRDAHAPLAELRVDKAAVLKPALPGGEKGVVFISFERNMQRLLGVGDEALQRFGRNYRIVVAPTWSPPHSPVGYLFPRMLPGPVFSTLSNERDLEIMPRLSERYRLLPLYASSWVNPAIFAPLPMAERDIDVIVLSNFAAYKRHHVLFRALARLTPARRPRVMLVGQPDGRRNGEVLLKEAADFGVRECVELRQSVADTEVCALLCRSKTALIASRREGSCVAVVEAMMAGTPVGILRGAEIGSSVFLNEQTGRWLDEGNLEHDLLRLIADAPSFSPREWLLQHGVDCHSSTREASAALREEALRNGEPWTQDLWTLHWRPNPRLLEPAQDRLAQAETEVIRQNHGIHFGIFEGMP